MDVMKSMIKEENEFYNRYKEGGKNLQVILQVILHTFGFTLPSSPSP